MWHQQSSEFRRADLPTVAGFPLEQPHSEFRLKRLDAAADRLLGEAQPIGGSAKATGLDHCEKVTEMTDVHVQSLSTIWVYGTPGKA